MAGRSNNLRRKLIGSWLACIVTLCASVAAAEEIQFFLRNGDRVTATILSETAQSVTLTSAVLGKFSLPLAQVERRTPLASPAAVPLTRPVAAAAPTSPAILPKPAIKLSGEAQAGMDLGFATKDRQFYTGRFKLAHAQSRLRNAMDYSFTYGYTDGEVSANRMDGSLKTDYDLTRRLYLYNLGGGGYDELRKLDNYFQFGPGAGDHLVKLTNFVLNLEGGANFQEQNRADGTQTDLFYYRLAQDSKWTLGPRLTLDQKVEFFPQWDDVSEYKLRFEANVKVWLNSKLFLNFSMIDLYDTMPAEGVDPNDLQLRSTIGLRF